MGLSCRWWAYVLAVGAPVAFWLIAAGLSPRRRKRNFLSALAGHDGRLSLSRLQAFAWTMVLFGAFVGAMSIHPVIAIATAARKQAAEAALTKADTDVTAAQTALTAAKAARVSAADAVAEDTELFNRATSRKKIADAGTVAEDKTKTLAALQATEATLVKDQDAKALADRRADRAERTLCTAKCAQKAAQQALRQLSWVKIPAELLALAGIALGSGVFASVISASGAADPNALVTTVTQVASVAGSSPPLTISGTGLDPKKIAVRIKSRIMSRPIDVDGNTALTSLTAAERANDGDVVIVDAPAAKFAFRMVGGAGVQTTSYEWGDLFRDDNDPRQFSIMKFQMFGWTLVALIYFLVIWCTNLSADMDSLPLVDATIVTLTGLSQAGYLGGKAASNIAR